MLLEQLLDNLAVSIEAFATCSVASGWRLRLPANDTVTLHYVVRGEGGVRDHEGRTLPLPAGTLAVVPPHLLHSLQSGPPPYGDAEPTGDTATAGALPEHRAGPAGADGSDGSDGEPLLVVCGQIQVTYGGGLGLFGQLREVLVLDFSDDAAMRVTFDAMLAEARSARPGARAMTSALMHGCLIRVFRELCELDECSISWLSALEDPAMAPVVQAMLERPQDPHTVASLAATAFMSRSAFSRRFRAAFGVPPHEYLRGVRLRHAAKLLKRSPPLPIPTVARRSGFSSRSQFSRAFRAHFGSSPTEYRG